MAYTFQDFKTKNALKKYVLNSHAPSFNGTKVRCYQPGLGFDLNDYTGKICLEGPHYPKAHTWYAEAELKDGVVIRVK